MHLPKFVLASQSHPVVLHQSLGVMDDLRPDTFHAVIVCWLSNAVCAVWCDILLLRLPKLGWHGVCMLHSALLRFDFVVQAKADERFSEHLT